MSLVFVDFEASSLSSRSYPIEVGCAWITDDHVVRVADLIRPDPTWPRDWSAESAAVHGIRRRELAHAEPAVSVARRYAALLTGATIVSDAPEFDAHWLGRLLEFLPLPPSVRLFDFDHPFVRLHAHGTGHVGTIPCKHRLPAPVGFGSAPTGAHAPPAPRLRRLWVETADQIVLWIETGRIGFGSKGRKSRI